MNTSAFYSKNLKIIFRESPFTILEISDRNTGRIFCKNGKQTITVRSPLHISDATLLSELVSFTQSEDSVRFVLSDDTNENKAEVVITDSEYGVKFKVKIEASEIIWLSEWKLTGFQFDNVIVPALGGQSLSKEMTPETTLSYKYPFWWNAQFALGEIENDGLFFHTKDDNPFLKLLRVRREEEEFHIVIGFEAEAPLNKHIMEAEWFIDSYEKDWRVPVDRHRTWLEQSAIGTELLPLNANPYLPEWINDINFVLELWGMRKDQPEPHHTFEQMIDRIKEWKKFHKPENTLLYLPGFAENGIDSHAPDYNPSEKCGGDLKFKELIDTAHELGYHIMLHTNVIALTFSHKLYPVLKKYQVIDAFNRPLGWGMDIDGDWLPEDFFAYVNPGFTEWGDHMEKTIGDLLSRYKPDAVFLDQTLLAFNISNGPNFLTGMRNHVQRLKKAFPHILFAGEGLNEQVLPALPFVQIHGIDSLSEVHGMEGKKTWRKVHPVSSYLFGKYTRFTAHLLTKYPSHQMFKLQENAYKELNVIPALCLYDYKQKMDIPEVKKMVQRAKKLKGIFHKNESLYFNKPETREIK
ncbi:MAG: DUF6259 domain-containing protein [Ignavibacteriaceae bacterium]